MRIVTVASCSLNQWAMDIKGNMRRVTKSIEEAKRRGARLRLGPELEMSGYGCEDHFLEPDTVNHCWEALASIMKTRVTEGILCDIGMPVLHNAVLYNCRVYVVGRTILLIRPKLSLCDDGNYREGRHFTSWSKHNSTETFHLPDVVSALTDQTSCPIGDAVLDVRGIRVASETCEELFTPCSPHIKYSLGGVHIISNGSGSHHTLRKLNRRLDLIRNAMSRCGGVYLYSNLKGCDGGRLVFDGGPIIAMNADVLAHGEQFSDLSEVEMVTATVDVDEVTAFRVGTRSRSQQADASCILAVVHCDAFSLVEEAGASQSSQLTQPIEIRALDPMEEISRGPAVWLWDYLRRSSGNGFLIPLSGGADSSAVLALCGSMCQMVMRSIDQGNAEVLGDVQRITQRGEGWVPATANDLVHHLVHTCYMATENNSSATRELAHTLATEVGSFHHQFQIDRVVWSVVELFHTVTGHRPNYRNGGGTQAEDLALQNIQARLRMVVAYMMAQLLPWCRGFGGGWLLVLSSGNVDEALRGYLTKYDCSSGDLNPIGAISKVDLKQFLMWASDNLGYPTLMAVAHAPPTAELRPDDPSGPQRDEAEMGMTYEELSVFGRLRKLSRLGPLSMFETLVRTWRFLSPSDVALKVKRFFRLYSINRHKMTTITPACHAEDYSPDDNRYDQRQILYNVGWDWQFARIDAALRGY